MYCVCYSIHFLPGLTVVIMASTGILFVKMCQMLILNNFILWSTHIYFINTVPKVA